MNPDSSYRLLAVTDAEFRGGKNSVLLPKTVIDGTSRSRTKQLPDDRNVLFRQLRAEDLTAFSGHAVVIDVAGSSLK